MEGQSELIFYKTLAKQIDIDLDRLNISILSVEGVGFKVYVKILAALKIGWVARTDNDIIKIPQKNEYRFAGVERGLELVKQSFIIEKEIQKSYQIMHLIFAAFHRKNIFQNNPRTQQ